MPSSFFDPGLWLMTYSYEALNDDPANWNYPSLAAPFWRVYWHNKTGAALRINKKILAIRPDHLVVIPSQIDCASIHHGNCRQLSIHFQLRHPYTLHGPPIIVLPFTKQRQYFLRRIIAGSNAEETIRQQVTLLVRSFLEALIADLMNQYLVFRQIDKRLLNALNYLEQHLDEQIDNTKLATLMYVNPRYMLRLFKAELGQSPQAYLRQLRVDKACWFLRYSDESIKYIAEATGFYDRYHFTKVFTSITGQSPSRFRNYNKPSSPQILLKGRQF